MGKGYGFVEFEDELVAEYVKLYASTSEFEGAWIVVKSGVDKEAKGSVRLFLGGMAVAGVAPTTASPTLQPPLAATAGMPPIGAPPAFTAFAPAVPGPPE